MKRIKGVKWVIAVLFTAISLPALAAAGLALSDDGRWIAYVNDQALWLTAANGRGNVEKISEVAGATALPRWAPKKNELAYYSNRSGNLQLWVFNVKSRANRQVSFIDEGIDPAKEAYLGGFGGNELTYSWSPDGSKIVFATRAKVEDSLPGAGPPADVYPAAEKLAAGEPLVLTNTTPDSWTLQGLVSFGHVTNESHNNDGTTSGVKPELPELRSTQLFILDVASGSAKKITKDNAGYFTPAWSPDGTQVAYMSAAGVIPDRSIRNTDIFVLDLHSGQSRKVSQGNAQKTLPLWSPDGAQLAYLYKDIVSSFARRSNNVQVTRVKAGREAAPSVLSVDRSIEGFQWSQDGTGILLNYTDGLMTPLVDIDLKSRKVSFISPLQASVGRTGPGFGSSRAGIGWVQQVDPNGAITLWIQHGRRSPRPLMDIVPPADPSKERRLEIRHWTNSRGEVLDGMLIYPDRHVPGKRYPLVVDAYGAGVMGLRNSGLMKNAYVQAARDYFVFRSNHRAPHMWLNPVKDPIYDAAAVGPNGISIMVDDVLSGIDTLIRDGLVDSGRMCIAGFSNGGLQAEQILTRTDVFKCALLQSPATSNWLEGVFLGYTEDTIRWMYGIAPWENPDIYTALVPLFHADKITTPILLAVGDREDSVIPTVEMYKVLRYLNKEVTLLRYATQGHGFKGAAEEDYARRVEAFFDRYLRSEEASSRL